jgi:hypothetical protein
MLSRTSIRWIVPLAALAACALGVVFANHRSSSFSETRGVASGGMRIPFLTSTKRSGPRPATAYPKTDPSKPGATKWIKYPADDVLPYGIGIGVCDGVIVGVVSEDPKHPDYELMCTRYVVGDLDATDITMPLWRRLDLKMPKPDGSVSELSVLRPLWWIQETSAKTGGTIDLGMQEIGISGEATVVQIGPCEADSRDNEKGSQVVTGTIKHHNAEVWDLVFNNDTKKPLGVTANHPIYSADRDDWVPAGELRLNEKVRTIDGTATLTSKSKRPGRETVYNLEVHRSHAYHVSQFGILAHNSSLVDCGSILKPGGVKIGLPGSSDRIRIVKGGLKDAEDMFLDLAIKGKGKDITPKGFSGMVVEFPDGGIIRFRPTSTSGPPTIDIVIKYLGIDEIKFIP